MSVLFTVGATTLRSRQKQRQNIIVQSLRRNIGLFAFIFGMKASLQRIIGWVSGMGYEKHISCTYPSVVAIVCSLPLNYGCGLHIGIGRVRCGYEYLLGAAD